MALGARRRSGAPEVREPPAHRVVQDPGRLRPHVSAHRGGAWPRRGRGLGRQPRPGRGACRPAARHPLDGLHAGGGSDPQGEGHPRLRRRGDLPRALPRGSPGDGAGVRRPHRGGADPPLRPRGHRRGAGDRRPGDPGAGARHEDRAGADRGRRAAGRHRPRDQGAGPRRPDDRCPGSRSRGLSRLAGERAPGRPDGDEDHGRRHRGRDAGRSHLRGGPRPRRRDHHGLRGFPVAGAAGPGRARQGGGGARRAPPRSPPCSTTPTPSTRRQSPCCRAATSTRCCSAR